MTLPASGIIKASQIQTEFGDKENPLNFNLRLIHIFQKFIMPIYNNK